MADHPWRSLQPAETIVRLRITCLQPLDPIPYDAQFGLQDQKRRVYEGRKQSNENVLYDIEVRARYDAEQKKPVFLGPWTNGTPDQRFLYLAWLPLHPEPPEGKPVGLPLWHRRAKIYLSTITWEQIEEANRIPYGLLEIQVPGRAKDGGPCCATLQGRWEISSDPSFHPIRPR